MRHRPTCLTTLAVCAVLVGCSAPGNTNDGDTGAAAPATRIDSPTTRADSTLGEGARTGQPGPAGDSLGGKAGRDSARRNPPAR